MDGRARLFFFAPSTDKTILVFSILPFSFQLFFSLQDKFSLPGWNDFFLIPASKSLSFSIQFFLSSSTDPPFPPRDGPFLCSNLRRDFPLAHPPAQHTFFSPMGARSRLFSPLRAASLFLPPLFSLSVTADVKEGDFLSRAS